jgi:hypothetical protein
VSRHRPGYESGDTPASQLPPPKTGVRRMSSRYRKRPVVIDATRWNGDNMGEVAAMFTDDLKSISPLGRSGERLLIRTLEGTMTAERGDWIIKGVKNEAYPCKDDIFQATYEAVDE